ncbi:hypothetical protein [Carnobacterium maltaromaticum]|uniref:hypothetical protein n=1 Tax=Carnobacterium maltaromaticum TaxID=2751 RepID=UPI0012F91A8A|nr:hypothetical protein [Carnobacterium maltaromaticum]
MDGSEALNYLIEKTKNWPEMVIFVNWGMDSNTREVTLVAAYSHLITEKASFLKDGTEHGIQETFFALTEKIFSKKRLNQWLEEIHLEKADARG